jgi:hypothetical protein
LLNLARNHLLSLTKSHLHLAPNLKPSTKPSQKPSSKLNLQPSPARSRRTSLASRSTQPEPFYQAKSEFIDQA